MENDNNTPCGQPKEAVKAKIMSDEDYIHSARFKNSIKVLIGSKPDGLENSGIAKVLLMTEEEVTKIYNKALQKLRKLIG